MICKVSSASDDNQNNGGTSAAKKKGGDNRAMAFLRKVGRVGGAANMDFADAMGLDESPSGGTKSSHHENGFKVSGNACICSLSTVCCAHSFL